MKLLFAIKSMDNAHGGAERVLADITAALAQRGHEIAVLTFDRQGGQSFYPLHPDVRAIDLGIGDTARRSNAGETLSRIAALRKTVRQEKPDVVIAFMHSMFVPMALAMAGMKKIPLVASEHIVPAYYKSRRFEFALFMATAFLMERITVLSGAIRDFYPRFLRPRMVVMPNPVSEISFDTVLPAKKQGARKIILNVGRLDEQKDQKALIGAFAGLAEEFRDWDVRIVGTGHLRKNLEGLIKTYGLEERVFLPGLTKNVAEEYAGADIFAMPSSYESFGLVTVEAFSTGLPVVGFQDCPGTNEIIQDGHNGLLVDGPDRVEAFAEGLRKLMNSEELRQTLGENGRITAASYSADIVYGNWEDFLVGVSEKRAA